MMAELDSESKRALAEAAEWRMLALLFEYPDVDWPEKVAALQSEIADSLLRSAAASALAEGAAGTHIALFGPGAPVSLREVTYRGGVQLGYLMSELSAYYNAFGYSNNLSEADDHLAVELSFLAFLCLKRAYAVSCEDSAGSDITGRAASEFQREHLSILAEPIAKALEGVAPACFHLAAKVLLDRVGPSPRGGSYPLCGYDSDDDETTCGGGQQSIAVSIAEITAAGPERS